MNIKIIFPTKVFLFLSLILSLVSLNTTPAQALYLPNSNPNFSQQKYLETIRAPQAWQLVGTKLTKNSDCTQVDECGGRASVKVAIIDSGVNIELTDLDQSKIDTANSLRIFDNNQQECVEQNQTSLLYIQKDTNDELEYYVCEQVGNQFDTSGDGSKLASIIGMQNNDLGGVGVAYNTTILPIAMHGRAFNTLSAGRAIDYALEQNAKIILLTSQSSNNDPVLHQKIKNANSKGVIIITASGDCAQQTAFSCGKGGDNQFSNPVLYPAAYPEVLTVGGVDNDYGRANYSGFGKIDVVAPSNSILVQCGLADSQFGPDSSSSCNSSQEFKTFNGTALAASQVAGSVVLAASLKPSINLATLRQDLQNSAKDLGASGKDSQFGYGLIHLENLFSTLFTDVPNNHVFATHIYNLRNQNVVNGFGNNTFGPDIFITRGQLAKIVKKGLDLPTSINNCEGFGDVDTANTFYEDITTLKCLGIVNGNNGKYLSDSFVTRGEAMKIVINSSRVKKGNPDFLKDLGGSQVFEDVNTDFIFFEYIQSAANNQIVNGDGTGNFRPSGLVTRGAISKIVDNTRTKTLGEG